MAEYVKCKCGNCGAKYRLPIEYQGRTARCKKCGEKFKVPRERSVEDSVLDWLKEAEAEENAAEDVIEQPRVVNISDSAAAAADSDKKKGPIRIKAETSKSAE